MELYEKALAFKEIENRLKAAKKPVDGEAREHFERRFDPGDRKTVWRTINGQRVLLGDLSIDKPGEPARAVTDEQAFMAWVDEKFPGKIVTRTIEVTEVDPDFRKDILADGHVIHPGTGEVLTPEGVDWVKPRTPAFRVTPAEGILDALAGEVAGLLELEGGTDE